MSLIIYSNNGVGIDFQIGTRIAQYLPPGNIATPFRGNTELREVYLTPKNLVGQIQTFKPWILFLSKLITSRGAKGGQDFLDIDRLLDYNEHHKGLGLQPQKFTRHLNAMREAEFLVLLKSVKHIWKETNKKVGQPLAKALKMAEWELERVPSITRRLSKKERRNLEDTTYEYWANALIPSK